MWETLIYFKKFLSRENGVLHNAHRHDTYMHVVPNHRKVVTLTRPPRVSARPKPLNDLCKAEAQKLDH